VHTESAANLLATDASYSVFGLQEALDRNLAAHVAKAGEYRSQFQSNLPFPHLVIDDFLPERIAQQLVDTFPGPESPIWTRQPTEDQRNKLATTDEGMIPALQRYVLFNLNSGAFVRFLERATGIEALIADTKLVGGGLHQIKSGGKLAVHIDYSHHPQNRLFRRLNFLLYLNPAWQEEYGGSLELWDRKISLCQKAILPRFNRAALFATSDISYHGHPEPLRTPEHVTRKSLSLYYFTKEPPAGRDDVEHNTLFKSRPGDRFNLGNFVVRSASSGLFRDLMPPLAYRGIRKLWNRFFTGK
jgi:Rps23 Pro-64 3,4-dihydroxylase Tpa1-like proline 4-hydroxylase